MGVHGNNLPGQDTSTYDAHVVVFEQETMMVGRGGQAVERVRPRPVSTRSTRRRMLFRRGHRYSRIAQRCTMFTGIIAARLPRVPELPDIVVYIEALEKRILGKRLDHVRIASPFLLRTAVPPLTDVEGKIVLQLRRLGKRICIGLENDIWLVLHLMIAGRLHWKKRDAKLSPPRGLAAFDFTNGTLLWTEAGSKKRASLHVVAGETGLGALDPGGLEIGRASC